MIPSSGGGSTIEEILAGLNSHFKQSDNTPGLDVQILLSHLLDKPRSWILAHPKMSLDNNQIKNLDEAVTQLEMGVPLPYVLGLREFFGLEFEVTPDVLIPRPETEALVERAINWLLRITGGTKKVKVIDVGTGSGCIAVALAVNVPKVIISATDFSISALEVARKNAEKFHISDRINFIKTDLFPDHPIADRYSLIVANLPYIPTETLRHLPIYGREPTLALDGGYDGLKVIRRFLEISPRWLVKGGSLMAEIEASEGPAVKSLAATIFPDARIQLLKDLAGHDRLLEVQT